MGNFLEGCFVLFVIFVVWIIISAIGSLFGGLVIAGLWLIITQTETTFLTLLTNAFWFLFIINAVISGLRVSAKLMD